MKGRVYLSKIKYLSYRPKVIFYYLQIYSLHSVLTLADMLAHKRMACVLSVTHSNYLAYITEIRQRLASTPGLHSQHSDEHLTSLCLPEYTHTHNPIHRASDSLTPNIVTKRATIPPSTHTYTVGHQLRLLITQDVVC